MPDGRFAPSPTGALHLGNLRTALVAWLFARASSSRFRLRLEDLDRERVRPEAVAGQPADLRVLGLDWDGPIVRQSESIGRHAAALERLTAAGLTYPCYCTRREVQAEVRAAPSAPHGSPAAYPGTCRHLSPARRAALEAAGRQPAIRLRGGGVVRFDDRLHGPQEGRVEDVVLWRGDQPAYQLAVVVDDADQGIGEVVRGDDLLSSTATQAFLARSLGLPVPAYAHVPLVLAPDGSRLAKRHGAVTLSDRVARGQSPPAVLGWLAWSLGLAARSERVTTDLLLQRFAPERLPPQPWRLEAAEL